MGRLVGNGARERLTRDRICEAGLEAIDEGGIECVSMRGLARSLGVQASSLYYHFENKEALMTGIAESLYRRLGTAPDLGDWEDQVKAIFLQLHAFILGHPKAAPLLISDLPNSGVAFKRATVLLVLLIRAGFSPAESASLLSNLVALLIGHSMLSVYGRDEAEGTGAGGYPSGSGADGGGEAENMMWVRKVIDSGVSPSDEERSPSASAFVEGLDAVIAGFVASRKGAQ